MWDDNSISDWLYNINSEQAPVEPALPGTLESSPPKASVDRATGAKRKRSPSTASEARCKKQLFRYAKQYHSMSGQRRSPPLTEHDLRLSQSELTPRASSTRSTTNAIFANPLYSIPPPPANPLIAQRPFAGSSGSQSAGRRVKRRVDGQHEDSLTDASGTTASTGTTQESAQSYESRKKRQPSPSKTSQRLAGLANPIKSGSFSEDVFTSLPAEARVFVSDLEHYAEGMAIVPISEKDRIRELLHDPALSRTDCYFKPTDLRDKLGGAPTLQQAMQISRESRKLSQRDEMEAAWNSSVHGPLLSMAYTLTAFAAHVEYSNITKAALLPRFKPSDPGLTRRMVDFAIMLTEDGALEKGLRCLEVEDDGQRYWNQTHYSAVASMPFAVSIETKREGEGFQDALNQLKVWAAAHFARLQELVAAKRTSAAANARAGQDQLTYPALPLLLAQGPLWHFMLAKKEPYEPLPGSSGYKIVLYSSILLGRSDTVTGVYRIVACLLRLWQWACVEYKPWFIANCVQTPQEA